ncbi:hypothetical protein BP5796_10100 [Coleophoma crateriformis]|uniref:Kinesin-like protein n=1 Tax=Coleophoma crateriformis TaxID=565419 RepID=A0A3D8QUN8_9HELO|nr:hypothetical protein BP5796_10100 [Coleophoma crateriformis]
MGSLKRPQTSVQEEPFPKRKTLAEKAGEFSSAAPAESTNRSGVRPKSIVGMKSSSNMGSLCSTRNPAFSSSVSASSSRTRLAPSRQTSNSSHASSVGPSGRPKSSHGRPQTSMAFNKSTTTRPNTSLARPRAITSMGQRHVEEEEESNHGRQDGMPPAPSFQSSVNFKTPSSTILNLKLRAAKSLQCIRPRYPVGNRDVSLSTAMSKLNINEEATGNYVHRNQVTISVCKPKSNIPLSQETSRSKGLPGVDGDCDKAIVLFQPQQGGLVTPRISSQIPVLSKSDAVVATPATPSKTPRNFKKSEHTPFLTKDSNITSFTAWDVRDRLESIESMYTDLKNNLNSTSLERSGLEEAVALYKARIAELETVRAQLTATNNAVEKELMTARERCDNLQHRLSDATIALDESVRNSRTELDAAKREHRDDIDQLRRDNAAEVDRLIRVHREEVYELEKRAKIELEERVREIERRNDDKLEDERSRRVREVQDLESRISSESTNLNVTLRSKDLEIQSMRGELEDIKGELDREQTLKGNLQKDLADMRESQQKAGAETSSAIGTLEGIISSLRAQVSFLESGSKAQSDSFKEMESRLQDALRSAEESKRKLIKEETLRRILFNQVQELKGNIRVMCRVRPTFGAEDNAAQISFPDSDKESKELALLGQEERSAMGNVSRKTHAFSFDRVFGPTTQNQEVFEEISQLVQSALDGYNVCIFCYGQTGAGKTHTMSSADGMIPRATHQIYETATNLRDKGWTYSMEGSFVEVYNEEIHDLLGSSKDFEKKKHEIRHDDQKKQTTVTGLKSVSLDSPDAVESILKQADANRSVAATKSNERSSRSHSVFILKLVGRNSTTGETSEGTLNLVDLAGSERLKISGAEGERMKETQNINKSLSCLGDVIGALGQGKEGTHIPYRNSKLTYLLQYSLGGNSKTLMFVMVSPLEANVKETLTSLKFATKVHNTHIGTAKKSTRVRGSES